MIPKCSYPVSGRAVSPFCSVLLCCYRGYHVLWYCAYIATVTVNSVPAVVDGQVLRRMDSSVPIFGGGPTVPTLLGNHGLLGGKSTAVADTTYLGAVHATLGGHPLAMGTDQEAATLAPDGRSQPIQFSNFILSRRMQWEQVQHPRVAPLRGPGHAASLRNQDAFLLTAATAVYHRLISSATAERRLRAHRGNNSVSPLSLLGNIGRLLLGHRYSNSVSSPSPLCSSEETLPRPSWQEKLITT